MRSAPSVSYPVGRSAFLAALLTGAGLLSLLALLLYLFDTPQVSAGGWGLLAAWTGWAGVAVVAWRRQACGRLSWHASSRRAGEQMPGTSGGEWVWSSAAYLEGVTLQRVERVYDLQAWMLLRLHNPDGARIWAWVERSGDLRCWDDLRRALVAHA